QWKPSANNFYLQPPPPFLPPPSYSLSKKGNPKSVNPSQRIPPPKNRRFPRSAVNASFRCR
ncbi:hypothetical protein A2U01_0107406, partial [Trifolium medium]|nr:hypothetical protein [Trifolium medium]